jgi:hypothetical protein
MNETVSPEAYESLVSEHVEMLHSVALRLTHDRRDALSLTERVLKEALHARPDFSKGGHIKPFLLQIMRNRFIGDSIGEIGNPAFNLMARIATPTDAPVVNELSTVLQEVVFGES